MVDCPWSRSNVRDDGNAHAVGGIPNSVGGVDFKAEPIADVLSGSLAQFPRGNLARNGAVHVDVDRRPHSEVTRQQRSGALHDPSLIDDVEAFEQSVVCHLALQLRQRPSARVRGCFQLVRQRAAERGGARVSELVSHRLESGRSAAARVTAHWLAA